MQYGSADVDGMGPGERWEDSDWSREEAPVIRSFSCSWCRAMNRETERWCRACGHAAHRPRLACDCLQCAQR